MELRAIIFDKDGVLSDSEKLKADAWQTTLALQRIEQGATWYLANLGPATVAVAAQACKDFHLTISPRALAEIWTKSYRQIESKADPIAENVEVLKTLAATYKIGIASSMDRKSILTELTRFGCMQYVGVCISGEDVLHNKPAPDVYLAAAAALDVPPASCLAVEDTPTGIAAAKAAGMRCLGYRNPRYHLDLSAADFLTDRLAAFDFNALS